MTDFRAPSLAGSSGEDSPNLTGWGTAALSGDQEIDVENEQETPRRPSWDELRCRGEFSGLEQFQVPPEAQQAFNNAMANWIIGDAHGFWMEPESKDGHCDPSAFVVTIGDRLCALTDAYNGKVTQSPIEDRLLGALLWINVDWSGFPNFDYLDGPRPVCERSQDAGLHFWITPQAKVAGYKVDFLLWFQMARVVGGIAIECDGHDFHEKNKEQAARDKKRDREILAAGYPMMRFTGSEIFRDSQACVEQITEVLPDILFRVSKDGGLF